MAYSVANNLPDEYLCHPTYGEELDILKQDQLIKSDPIDNRRRRTIVIKHMLQGKELPSCGFTLQSYGLLNRKSYNSRLLTYVDHVENDGPAQVAGLRPGDVILSINGISMENADHKTLVNFIRSSGPTLRMIVIFEDCCRKIDLHLRCLKLQNTLNEKVRLLKALEAEELSLLRGLSTHETPSVYGSENSILSYYSEDREVFSSCDTPLQTVLGGMENVSSMYSLDSSNVHELPDSASDTVFLEAPICKYECNSLPSDLSRRRNARLKTSETANAMSVSLSSENSVAAKTAPKREPKTIGETSFVPENHVVNPRLPEVPQRIKTRLSDRAARGSLRISKLRDSFKRHINTDIRLTTRRLHQLMSNHVLVEDAIDADLPQLVSLKRLCHDFRTSCLQQNLEQRRKSTDWMMSSFQPPPGFIGDELMMSRMFEVSSTEESSLPEVETSTNSKQQDSQTISAGNLAVEESCYSENDLYINEKDEFTKL